MMNKDTLLEIFNELLEEWYWSEYACINEFSVSMAKDQDELENRKKEFMKRFTNALDI